MAGRFSLLDGGRPSKKGTKLLNMFAIWFSFSFEDNDVPAPDVYLSIYVSVRLLIRNGFEIVSVYS
jgi:hypothetical protein